VVRMIEHYLGSQKFRAGVRAYIRKHRESNAVAADLWDALEEASDQPVAELARAWIKQPGFPLVTLAADAPAAATPSRGTNVKSAGGGLIVKQERFRASPITRRGDAKRETWPVPLVLKLGRSAGKTGGVERPLAETSSGGAARDGSGAGRIAARRNVK